MIQNQLNDGVGHLCNSKMDNERKCLNNAMPIEKINDHGVRFDIQSPKLTKIFQFKILIKILLDANVEF